MIAPMVGAHRVRPKCHLDISTKLRCTRHNHLCHCFWKMVWQQGL